MMRMNSKDTTYYTNYKIIYLYRFSHKTYEA